MLGILIKIYYEKVRNTSFNLHGEPIVVTIDDADRTFERSEIDHLLIGDHILLSKRKG
ncbi:hypothetical protein CEW83_19920 [Parazoarcus communis]|uniref:Carbamoyltransferase C-terminal domain-containing protein n=1 Tax=Parazoarcus communis TaxID=41977 RepID=A0A2U8GXZ9_9RHOO|nr:hypothetical protein CEW83_19920 [Parazoarcus communis]